MTKPIIPPAALNQHIAILGKTGSGKSYAAKGIVEQLLQEQRQVCVVDPTAAWWGLRLAADGKSRGFDVVLLGGQHADIPLAERSGSAVARLVTEQGANVVLDTSGFTVGEYTRWFIDFAGTLFTTIRNPLHLVIDEAHHFMPQGKSPDVDAGKMLHAGNRLMSGGRSKGVRGMLITQRPAKLHKDSLSCADTLIAMRVMAPQDRDAIKDWIDGAGDPTQGKAVLSSLAQLQRGEGWVWYPEGGHLEREKFPKIKTYDSSATPAHGAKAGPKVAEIDLGEVQKAMAEAVKEAEANDPKLLRQRIAELEREAKAKPGPATVVDQAAIDRACAARDRKWQKVLKERETIIGQLKGRMTKAADLLHVNGEAVAASPAPEIKSASDSIPSPILHTAKTGLSVAVKPRRSPSVGSQPVGDLGKAERAVLAALYWVRDEAITPSKVAFYAGYSVTSSSFGNALSGLRSRGLLAGWKVTDEGESLVAAVAGEKPSGADLRQMLRSKLGKAENTLLDALIEAYPDRLDYTGLSEASGYSETSSSFGNALSTLRTIEAVEGGKAEGVRASDVFFG